MFLLHISLFCYFFICVVSKLFYALTNAAMSLWLIHLSDLIRALYEQRENYTFEKVVYCPKRGLSCLVKSYRDSLKAEASNDNRN